MESLTAAVRAGADAVYLGLKSLNARMGAESFDENSLALAVNYCHIRDVKVYLTLNTLVFNSEIILLKDALKTACNAGVDAVLVQDLAVVRIIKARCPGLEIHGSTQMAVHNLSGVKMLEELGFKRAVLARELSLGEIQHIAQNTSLETECFVHGALCMSVSGQCYLSSMIGGRSGNRGMCAQPCRLPFKSGGFQNALSLKDLCALDYIEKLKEAGVKSFKIEGRLKRPEYVAAAVNEYRKALNGKKTDPQLLKAVFSRSGFTAGYLSGKRGDSMFGVRQKSDAASGEKVFADIRRLYEKERPKIPLKCCFLLKKGEKTCLFLTDLRQNKAAVYGPVPEEAITSPLGYDKAKSLLSKLGGTPYFIEDFTLECGENLMLPTSEINAMRREAVAKMSELRAKRPPLTFKDCGFSLPAAQPHSFNGDMYVRLNHSGQITEKAVKHAKKLVLPAEEILKLDKDIVQRLSGILCADTGNVFYNGQRLTDSLARVKKLGIKNACTGNIGGIHLLKGMGFDVLGDFTLNITNALSLAMYSEIGLSEAILSIEISAGDIPAVTGSIPAGIVGYGYLPLMSLRTPPAGSGGEAVLTDRLGGKFRTQKSGGIYNLLNKDPVYVLDMPEKFKGISFITLNFTDESPEDVDKVIDMYLGRDKAEFPYTRGLYFRKVF